MRTLGLLGGMSWESSIEYERLINTGIRHRLGGSSAGDLIIRSYDFGRIESLQAAGEWDELASMLASDAAWLEAAGAECIVICTNTMHLAADSIREAVSVPLLHIGDVTARAVGEADVDTVALLGTRYTMETGFYADRLAEAGIGTIIPAEPDRAEIHRIIYDELVQGIIDGRSRSMALTIIERLMERGAEGVIAGCTEIELLVAPDDVDVPYFPTAALHAAAAVDFALGDA